MKTKQIIKIIFSIMLFFILSCSEEEKENKSPVIEITQPESENVYFNNEEVNFKCSAVDPEDGVLTGNSIEWYVNNQFYSSGNETAADLNTGGYTIKAQTHDSKGLSASDSLEITVEDFIDTSPDVQIFFPQSESNYFYSDEIAFAGIANDAQDGELTDNSLVWTSNKDGFLGFGNSFALSRLSVNEHVIKLTGTDSFGNSSSDSVIITVQQEPDIYPVVEIISPQTNSVFQLGDEINFTGYANDNTDGELSGNVLKWHSDKDGFLSYGNSFTTSQLTGNTHRIIFSGQNSLGYSSSDTVRITVNDPYNEAPVTIIETPEENSEFTNTDNIVFKGHSADPEDGGLTGSKLKWFSNLDGQLGIGGEINVTGLSPGEHSIILRGKDSNGTCGDDTVNISILNSENTLPEIFITSPGDGDFFTSEDEILFKCTVHDAEDGEISGTAVQWYSDKDGLFGFGNHIIAELSVNSHIITCRAEDSEGVSDSENIFIYIIQGNNPPSVYIAFPETGDELSYVKDYNFRGSAYDTEDGTIPQEDLKWYSDEDGFLGSGSPLSVSGLSIGNHRISLLAKDSQGGVESEYADITVRDLEPVVNITKPQNYSQFVLGEDIEFKGEYEDIEDIEIPDENLIWSSSVDGFIGNGTNIFSSNLSGGSHTIYFKAVDSYEQAAIDSIHITVQSTVFNVEWIKTYGNTGDDSFRKIIFDESIEKIVAVGYYGYPDYQGWFAVFDLDGNLINDTKYREYDDCRFYDIIKKDDNYLLIGHSDLSASVKNAYIAEVDIGGAIQNDFRLSNADYNYTKFMDGVYKNEYLYFCGYLRENPSGYFDSFYTKFGVDLDLIWSRSYSNSEVNEAVHSFKVSDTGNIIAPGYSYDSGFNNGNRYISMVDSEGNLNWIKTFDDQGVNTFSCMIETSDGSYLSGGIYGRNEMQNVSMHQLTKFDLEGNIIWEKHYGYPGVNNYVCDIIELDGVFYFVGIGGGESSNDGKIYIGKVNGNGDLTADKIIESETYDAAASICTDGNGNFYISGSYGGYNSSQSQAFLMKFTISE